MDKILEEIIFNKDSDYREFQKKLLPGVENILGLRGPEAKKIAKKYANTDTGKIFLSRLPHSCYDENLVHGYMLGYIKADVNEMERYIKDFLPCVDNWAVCDSMVCNLKNFFKNPKDVSDFIFECLKSDEIYTVRFALVSLLSYYVNSEYIDRIFRETTEIKNDEYYVKMAIAWLYSVCLVKEYDKTVSIMKKRILDSWTHNKAIQKSIESFRITDVKKDYLRTLKMK